ncbi:TPR domain-containing protein [Cordyceps fumosorosea ARSEF 2679]|uniref:TPR domain-containing protein n=1 Tax=Cordyceps fumosorosea (strain ARSEF 2679) TaxID=1081104 RepID=A0A167QHZ3_CORFA|nr:TPR domain-containing protein [Cordyceps fumosorosea ARSEF 2679]OAA57659.1 TPR domain-containing protein [Cordyceps fumosorosea ARSEF 2679]
MSTFAIASLRPIPARCLHTTKGLLSVHVASPSSSAHLRMVISLPPRWQRHQSTSALDGVQKNSAHNKPQKVTFRQFAGRALGAGLKNLAFALSPRGIKQAYKDSPGSTSFAVVLLLITLGISAVALRSFYAHFYNNKLSKYPEPVANTLRRAIYYSNYAPDPELALKFYKKAMQQCAEIGLDPFSDEVLGIRIQVSAWLQQLENYTSSGEVLESILADCQNWIGVMEKSVEDGQVDKGGYYVDSSNLADAKDLTGRDSKLPTNSEKGTKGEESEAPHETLWRKRERLLATAVKTAVALGELYADEHVLKPEKATEHFVWAVETTLKEFNRRRTEGKKPGEESWLTPTEVGGAMESLGRDYERKSQFHLAIPLFFQALRLCEVPCHRAVVMNNLAASFAQIPASFLSSSLSEGLKDLESAEMPKTRSESLAAAENWAKNAYMHGNDVKRDERTPECDEACAVALCNWADVAAMLGKTTLARQKYEQCIELSNKLKFADGAKQAADGLKKLNKGSN